MRFFYAWAFAICAATAAQGQDDQTAIIDDLLETALAEHRIFLTCTSLMPPFHEQIRNIWAEQVDNAPYYLTQLEYDERKAAAFVEAAAYDALMPAKDATFADVTALCETEPDWVRRHYRLEFVLLQSELGKLLEDKRSAESP